MLKKIIISIPMIILAMLSPVSPIFDIPLNTKKIDENIEKLLNYSWFKELYNSDQYRHLFFGNRRVRSRLSNKFYVNRLINDKGTQYRFCKFLEKVSKKKLNRI